MRLRPLWVWRAAFLGFAVCYLASSSLQEWLPPLLPFLAAAAVEAHFFVAGTRTRRGYRTPSDPGPQQRDLEELGWAEDVEEDEEAGPSDTPSPPPVPQHRTSWLRRLVPALAVLAILAGLVFLDSATAHWQRLSHARRAATVLLLDRQASLIAGHRATIVCDTSGTHVGYVQDADGLAEVGGRRAWLTPQVCYQLYLVTRGHPGGGAGHAIAVLAHESWHLHGEASEARANCFAYQSGVAVGEGLGLASAKARQLMRDELAANPTDFSDAPQYIVPPGCKQGGSLDLHLDGDSFP
jgi:hypothetical protein